MEIYLRRDICEHKRFHTDFTDLQKGSLVLDDLGRDFDQRLIAALQAFHEPAGFLQLFFDIAPVGRRSIAEHRNIVIIH